MPAAQSMPDRFCYTNVLHLVQMLQQGCDINCADYDARTGLMLAASHGHEALVQKLLHAGASVNLQDKLGSTALLEAAKAGYDGVIE